MAIKIFPSQSWLEFRSLPERPGLNTTTHMALVADHNGVAQKCYLKFINVQESPGLLCEGIGWLVAKAAGIDVPDFAAIVLVPLDKLAKSMKIPTWMNGYAEYPAWCVKAVDGKSIAQINKWSAWLRRSQCLSAKSTPALAAFDKWIDNRDRNYGNIIRISAKNYSAIDHEKILYELLWVNSYQITFDERSLLIQAAANLDDVKRHNFLCSAAKAADGHSRALDSSAQEIIQYLSYIVVGDQESKLLWDAIQKFLKSRSTPGWMANELGVIV